ncbi:MAG TPA: response regulator [Allosphingosinicella sp.]|uniref:response regulator n=1 Tax=Allosphingosinicella sp. TaxID=2823234 RepID=UPI002ED7CA1C
MTPQPNARSVLIVEDEAFTRMAAVDTVTDLGFESFEAGDAAEALDVLEEHPQVNILFTDINMPGTMDGLALAQLVHEVRPEVELIITSGAQTLAEEDIPDHGAFLPKPYAPDQLAALLQDGVRSRSISGQSTD